MRTVSGWGRRHALPLRRRSRPGRWALIASSDPSVRTAAVGCGQKVFVKDGKIIQIEGDPASPISRGRLCPKGSATHQLVTSPARLTKVRYRRPGGTDWEDLPLARAMEMIADRVLSARAAGWQEKRDDGRRLRRTMGFAHLGGATLDNEENYLIKKLYTALGAIQIENQARV